MTVNISMHLNKTILTKEIILSYRNDDYLILLKIMVLNKLGIFNNLA